MYMGVCQNLLDGEGTKSIQVCAEVCAAYIYIGLAADFPGGVRRGLRQVCWASSRE